MDGPSSELRLNITTTNLSALHDVSQSLGTELIP